MADSYISIAGVLEGCRISWMNGDVGTGPRGQHRLNTQMRNLSLGWEAAVVVISIW
jgi:hypothetical protein